MGKAAKGVGVEHSDEAASQHSDADSATHAVAPRCRHGLD